MNFDQFKSTRKFLLPDQFKSVLYEADDYEASGFYTYHGETFIVRNYESSKYEFFLVIANLQFQSNCLESLEQILYDLFVKTEVLTNEEQKSL